MSPEERQRILETWSGAPLDANLARAELLHEFFERTADRFPQQTALVCGPEQLSYAELERRANCLAHVLRSQGIGPESCAALWLPRSLEIYVAMLGILKAGGAYVPLDPDYPPDRVEFILEDSQAKVLITTSAMAARLKAHPGTVICLDADWPRISARDARRLSAAETQTTAANLSYVIYTSGTTGRPKGVQIEHRNACNLVRAEGKIFQVKPEDRVYQGFSVAFDASVEEIWLAFHAGATLVIGTREMAQAGPELARLLTQAKVTVFSTVPTLLSMLEDDLPTVRLLILGGEACPPHFVQRWSRPHRRMFNTYGPTEATVIATYTECDPAKPVTIGRPVPNYSVYILNDELQPVPTGKTGELYLGGVGVARGYVGRPELTRGKFLPNPFANPGDYNQRLYRTGDLARFNFEGEIEFAGRADTQVKLRGFRIELAEIEAVLLECDAVQAAVVTVREDVPGVPQLVGYIVPRTSRTTGEEQLKTAIRSRLPAYMVPALLELIEELPTLPSGKVDRRKLPAPKPRATATRRDHVAPRTELEKKIAAVWSNLFAPAVISLHDDFFLDLGGHSLLAARMISQLRQDPELRNASILDVYNHPTVAGLAARLAPQAANEATPQPDRETQATPRKTSSLKHFLCGLAQFHGLYLILGFFSLQWLAPYLTYTWMFEDEYSRLESILGALLVLVLVYPAMLLASIAVKWIVIGRYQPGNYPLWGWFYFRWWFVNSIESAIPIHYLSGTPLLNIYLRLMGAKIGANVHLSSDNFGIYDLITIADDTSVGTDTHIAGYKVEDGLLKLGPVKIGQRCYVGTRAYLRENTVMEDDAMLEDLSLLPAGSRIPAGERWLGSPARLSPQATVEPGLPRSGWWQRFGYGLLHAVGVVLFPALVLAAVFPGMMLMNYLNYEDDYYWYLLTAPVIALTFIVLLCVEIAIIKWALLGRVKPGRYRLHSSFYFRKWFVDQMMDLSLDFLGPLYASIYLPPWYRLLGAKLGARAEISTASFISPDLLHIGDESFIADSVSLGAARVEKNVVTVAENRIGKRSFVGNSAMLPPGTVLGDNSLIGCLSAPPVNLKEATRDDATWLGSPSFSLPQRQHSTGFAEESTFKPTAKLRYLRGAIEFIRVILPSSCFIILTSLLFSVVVLVEDNLEPYQLLLLFPVLYAGCGVIAVLFTVAMKWLLVGRYRASEKPLWSTFVWRNELINALHEHLACEFIVSILTGTPFVCWFFRLLGTKIGRRVYMETTEITEYDLVKIGDDTILNRDSTLQTHLFEDRVMKMSTVEIAPDCNVGSLSLVLYDTKMEPGSSLGELSLLMKGETLPANTHWEGIPARAIAKAQ